VGNGQKGGGKRERRGGEGEELRIGEGVGRGWGEGMRGFARGKRTRGSGEGRGEGEGWARVRKRGGPKDFNESLWRGGYKSEHRGAASWWGGRGRQEGCVGLGEEMVKQRG